MQRGILVLAVALAVALVLWFGVRDAETPTPTPDEPGPPPDEQPLEAKAPPEKGPELEAKGKEREEAPKAEPLPPIPEDSCTVTGRVLDDRRRPVAGAMISIAPGYDAPPTRTATSATDGRFEIPGLARPGEVWRGFAVRAAKDDQAGVGGSGIWSQSPDSIDVGVITLRPGHTLDVQVRTEAGAAVAEADVFLETRVQWTARCVVARARTDASGACTLDNVAEQTYRVLVAAPGHGRGVSTVVLPRGEAGPIVVTLGSERPLTVVVTDKDTGEPIEGASLLVEEHVRGVLGMAGQIVPYVPALEGLVTDAKGRAALPGLGQQDAVQVHALAAGYPRPGGSRMIVSSPIKDGEIHLQLQKLRTVKWPIHADSNPMPAEGTELRLEPARGAMTRPLPPTARVEDGHVVADDCDPGLFHALAIAPDGSYARIFVMHNSDVGRDATFMKTKRVVVTVKQAAGTPVEGVYVSLRSQGNNVVVDPTPTDAEGRVELDVRWAHLLDVMVSRTSAPYSGKPGASINLKKKDGGEVEVTLPAPGRRVELTVLIDGEARLPPSYTLTYARQFPIDMQEDPENGILRFRLPAAGGGKLRWALNAPGFLSTTVEFPAVEGDAVAKTKVELSRGGTCVVRVKPPADGKYQNNLRQVGAKTPGFALPMMGAAPQSLGTRDGWALTRHGPLKPGRYQAFDRTSRVQSAIVEVKDGEETVVDLDLSAVTVIKGNVEVPEGFEAHKARVSMQAEGLYANPYPGWHDGAYVRQNGDFEIRVPGTQTVRLTVKHPELVPHAEHGTAEAKDGSTPVRLKLVAGSSAVFRLDPPIEQKGRGGPRATVRVYLYKGEPAGKADQQLTPAFKDGLFTITGFEPGTYTVVVDARKRAPGVVKNAELGDGKNDLGTVTLAEGASVRIKLKIKEGEDPPRIFASAHCKAPVMYTRYVNSRGEREVLLTGLGKGTFQLRASPMRGMGMPGKGSKRALNETIESDGRTEIIKELDLR